MNLAGIQRRESISCGIGPADAVAHVAHRRNMRTGRRIHHGLATFTGKLPSAARRHHRHVAGVEIHTKGWRNRGPCSAPWSRRWRTARNRRGGIRCAFGVNVEGAVFLDNPAIVGNLSGLVSTVQNLDQQIAGSREGNVHSRSRAEDSLRILRLEGERRRATGRGSTRRGQRNGETAARIPHNSRSCKRCSGERKALRVCTRCKDSRGLDGQVCGRVRGIRGAAADDCAACITRTQCHCSGQTRRAHTRRYRTVRAIGEGIRGSSTARIGNIREGTIGVEGHCTISSRRQEVNAVDVRVVGDYALAGIRNREFLACNKRMVAIVARHRTGKHAGAVRDRESGPINANVGEHAGVTRGGVARQT